jgi:hypothetical protein
MPDSQLAHDGRNTAPPASTLPLRVEPIAAQFAKREVVEALAGLGVTPALMGPDELGQFIPSEVKRRSELIKEAGITPE